jgi:cytochrome c
MRISLNILVFACVAGNFGLAHADYDLAQARNCLACHSVDKRKYGPNFKQIAEKYGGQAGAIELVAKKVKSGGAGVWGEYDMMPPQPQVTDDEARILAAYILSVK